MNKYRVGRILEFYVWYHMHPGLEKRVKFANFRLPSTFTSPYFVRASRVVVNDYSDEFILASVANDLSITHGAEVFRLYWYRERSVDYSAIKSKGWAPSIHNFRYVESSLIERFRWFITSTKAK